MIHTCSNLHQKACLLLDRRIIVPGELNKSLSSAFHGPHVLVMLRKRWLFLTVCQSRHLVPLLSVLQLWLVPAVALAFYLPAYYVMLLFYLLPKVYCQLQASPEMEISDRQ